MTDWQTMDTAPKDGTIVDLIDSEGVRAPDYYWDDGHWKYVGRFAPWFTGFMTLSTEPLYWRPVPAIPALAAHKGPVQ